MIRLDRGTGFQLARDIMLIQMPTFKAIQRLPGVEKVCPSLPQTQIPNGGRNCDCHVDFTKWVQLKPCYAHAHGCAQAFLPPVIVVLSNFSGVAWTDNILSVF